MNHAIETSVDQIMMAALFGKEYAGHALAAPEKGPRKFYANMSGNGLIDDSLYALIWKPIN